MDARIPVYAASLAIAAAVSISGPASAQERHDRGRHEGYRTPHWVYDDRYHHGHYYPAPGYAMPALPPGYMSLRFRNRAFFFNAGVWYEPVGPRFVVVHPP
ncbi:MAG TPA: DUF6515 family protein, partial [Burkholderiales bacterium]|nr:DUF6515 family protein [Burkholderiales bacterium]